jgi:hypothetical protein
MLSVGYATQRYGTGGKCKPPDEFIPGGPGVANSSEARGSWRVRSAIYSHLECGHLSRLLFRPHTGLLRQG